MPRTYILSLVPSSLTAAGVGTVLWLNPPASRSLEIVRLIVGQRGTTTADATAVRLSRQVSTFPTLVTTGLTLAKLDPNDAASAITLATTGAAGTAGALASGEGGGAKTAVEDFPFLNTAGLDLWFPERERIVLPAGDTSGLALHFPTTPAATTNWMASLWFRER